MVKFLVAWLFILAPVLARPQAEVDPHVVGGTEASEGSYPFMVSLRRANGIFYCGGALISKRFVLTAAHCIHDPRDILIGVGSIYLEEQTLYEADRTFIYPDYDPMDGDHDLGLISLVEPLELGPLVQTIKFPYPNDPDNKNVTAMGWGRTSVIDGISPVLLTLNRSTLTNEECNQRLEMYGGASVGEGHICLGSTMHLGMCYGDSGSPLLYVENNENYAVGLVSWGLPCARGYPDVFIRISHYASWLEYIMFQR